MWYWLTTSSPSLLTITHPALDPQPAGHTLLRSRLADHWLFRSALACQLPVILLHSGSLTTGRPAPPWPANCWLPCSTLAYQLLAVHSVLACQPLVIQLYSGLLTAGHP
eukprot:g38930.t1